MTAPPIHPGEFFREDVLIPLGIDVQTAAEATDLSVDYVQALVEERASIDQRAAEVIAKFYGGDPSIWISLQAHYDRLISEDS